MTARALTMVKVADVDPAPWNVNVMDEEQLAELRRGMKASGPDACDPIDTCLLEGKRYTIDGAHRLKVAKALDWKEIPEIFHAEITTEQDARLFNYQRDFARGTIDPFKLAESFKWFGDQGETQEQIAKRFGIEKSTVSKRLSLLGLDKEVKKQVTTDTAFTVSSIEPLATLSPELQDKALKEVKRNSERGRQLTSREVENVVQEVKREDAEQEALKEAVAASEFKTCPTCKKQPVEATYNKLPWVRCPTSTWSSEHEWNLKTGKTRKQLEDEDRKERTTKSQAKAREGPEQFVRTTHSVSEWKEALATFVISELLPNLEEISEIQLEGKGKGGRLSLSVDEWAGSGVLTIDYEGLGKKMRYTLEPKKYEAAALKEFKTVITGTKTIKNEGDQKELEALALGFLKKYGPKDAARQQKK